jgi:survival motor neuron protein
LQATETTEPTASDSNEKAGVVWDDSLIIKTYDGSLDLLKEDVAKIIATKTNKKGAIKKPEENGAVNQFKVGDYVRSTYSDGVDYEARIIKMNDDDETCKIRYVGYENEEIVNVVDLIQTWGKKARRKQKEEAKESVMSNCASSAKPDAELDTDDAVDEKPSSSTRKNKIKVNFGKYFMPGSKFSIPPPPPMPPIPSGEDGEEMDDSLSAMLMSWYMAGYYAGYYQAEKRHKST